MSRPPGGGVAAPAPERFRAKYVQVASGCWNWIGAKTGRGYGSFSFGGHGKTVLAHRWSYEHHVGLIIGDLTIDHKCRNKVCVNPAHLETVTAQENIARYYATVTHCKHGHLLAGENLCVRKDGKRACRECKKVASRKHEAMLRQYEKPSSPPHPRRRIILVAGRLAVGLA